MIFFGLKKLEQNYDVDIRWRAYELRPAGSRQISPEYRARIEQSRPAFAERMMTAYGVMIKPGPFGIDSRKALILDKYAEVPRLGDEFHIAVLEAYWQHGKDISDVNVLKELAVQVGINPAMLDAALMEPVHAQAVDDDIAQAQAYGLTGVPAIVFNNRYLVMGAQPYETLAQAVKTAQAN